MDRRPRRPGHRGRRSVVANEQETQPGHNVFVTRSSWAGFRVDRPGRNERIYHGALGPDGDFEALVFRIRLP